MNHASEGRSQEGVQCDNNNHLRQNGDVNLGRPSEEI